MQRGQFVDTMFQKLEQRGFTNDWNAEQLVSAIIHIMNGGLFPPNPPPLSAVAVAVTKDTIINIPDDVMIFEMVKRGFAVMKLPEAGGPPEVLK